MPAFFARNWGWAALTFAVGLFVGALVARIALSGVPVLSEGFVDALAGALAGGIFVLIGGVLGSAYLGSLERDDRIERQRNELTGGALLVLYEMQHNVALLEVLAESDNSVAVLPISLSTSALSQNQTILARGLPVKLIVQLELAFSTLQIAQDKVTIGRRRGRLQETEREHLLRIATRMQAAALALRAHIETSLGYTLPPISDEDMQRFAGIIAIDEPPAPEPEAQPARPI